MTSEEIIDSAVPPVDETPEPTEAEQAAALDATHAEMWAQLDGKSPFEWPEDARNLYQSGCTCSLWGRSVVDMSPEQRILFVAYVDTIASDLMNQCRGLSAAIEMHNSVAATTDGEESLPGPGLNPEGEN